MDSVAVLDFGCQYTHQIGEAVRRAGVYSEILPCDTSAKDLKRFKGIILSGGPNSVYEKGSPKCDPKVFSLGKPVLGICYGLQLMAQELGGEVKGASVGEYGEARIKVTKQSPLLKGFGFGIVWMSHGDSVTRLPEGFEIMAKSNEGLLAAMGDETRKIYGLQFHPEVAHTEYGDQVYRNFCLDICECIQEWTPGNYIEDSVKRIREQVRDGHAVILASGGVDSTVAAVLAKKALGDKVRAIHIDTGLERLGEGEKVKKVLGEFGIPVEVINASGYVLGKLKGVLEPEAKRKIIGDAYIEILYKQLKGFEEDETAFLVQGTLYADSIESSEGVGDKADLIKSHHNVGSEVVKTLKKKGRVVEPNDRFFKRETRQIARELGLSEEISERHPFPGPGLGVMHVGRVWKPEDYQDVKDKSREILEESGFSGKVIPVGNVGVKGSARAYGNVVLIKGERGEYEKVRQVSNMLGNKIRNVTRAVMLIQGKDFSQEEWDSIPEMPITRQGLEIHKKVDKILMDMLTEHGLYSNIEQMSIILFPGPDKPWVALRPCVTPDYMTVRPPHIPEEMTWEFFDNAWKGLEKLGEVDGLVLDTTNKPPATYEWE
jgi:GMP synthase (glutamine-hydrolysing)